MPQARGRKAGKGGKRFIPYPKQVENKDKQRRMAWAKYYDERQEHFLSRLAIVHMAKSLNDATNIAQSSTKETKLCMPAHVLSEYLETAKACQKEVTCPGKCVLTKENYTMTKCGHFYCKPCFEKIKTEFGKCSLCKANL